MTYESVYDNKLWPRVAMKEAQCWEWLGSKDRHGYGIARLHGKSKRVHRVVYELLVGPVGAHLDLHHKCEKKGCCNPEHLVPLTRAEHISVTPRPVTTHCKHGHPFDEANTYLWGNQRCCRACNKVHTNRKRGLPDLPVRHSASCRRCGYIWESRSLHPKACAKCKARIPGAWKHHSGGKPCPRKPHLEELMSEQDFPSAGDGLAV